MWFTTYVVVSLLIVTRNFYLAQAKKFFKEAGDLFDPDTVEVEHAKLTAKVKALKRIKELQAAQLKEE